MSEHFSSTLHTGSDHSGQVDAVVVGAGFAGLYMLYKLRLLGLRVQVFEANADVGGTWYANRYPGLRCDAESVEYSYSWSEDLQQDWCWSERFATQPEILSYIRHVAERFDLRRHIQFDTRVSSAVFDEARGLWQVRTDQGNAISARYFIMASGCLSSARLPSFEGLETFEGDCYHTVDWPKAGVDFRGKRVGIIGTGSTGVQLIPVAAQQAEHLYVFQRTPAYVVPARNAPLEADYVSRIKNDYVAIRAVARQQGLGLYPRPTESAVEVSPETREQTFERQWSVGGPQFMFTYKDMLTNKEANQYAVDFLHRKIRSIVTRPEVADELCSHDYPVGAKRICVGTDYYETYNRDNVSLVNVRKSPIERIVPKGIRTRDGDYALDAIVFATGYDAMTGALLDVDIRGLGGRRLADKWAAGPQNYLGVSVSEFPNFFMITGPGSPSVFSNVVLSIEQHVDWVSDCLQYMQEKGWSRVAVKEQAVLDWVEHVNQVANSTLIPQANSWYVGANIPGKPRVFMPYVGGVGPFRKKCDAEAESGYASFEFSAV
ncbi:flavin-containing monooxygenase [Pseudomonas sp. PDM09]|uniref:flavin-containing monooxygenase n=1 Tax=Pseudomonas sp. PDM09 TaxID=2769270 RepID=UPI001784E600|nr:NAD(P)/FAD-dependent oxidoreductase [Pseudomonas sp. PDM09]MBD9562268.1 NAD(P)/FAD-dependent oxidoreductase [Pseudomonas sp. PDM09]